MSACTVVQDVPLETPLLGLHTLGCTAAAPAVTAVCVYSKHKRQRQYRLSAKALVVVVSVCVQRV
jgi:hypothetical protein